MNDIEKLTDALIAAARHSGESRAWDDEIASARTALLAAVQQAEPVAWRVRGYAQFNTGKPGPWRYFDGPTQPQVSVPPAEVLRKAGPDHPAILAAYHHRSVNHSAKQFVDGMAHTNGIESVWAVLKRGFYGVYHQFSQKHLQRYVDEFAYRLNEGNVRVHTMDRIDALINKTLGVRLTYANLTREFA